jgi:hypothetical protein
VNLDRPSLWLGITIGLLFAALLFELCKWFDAHLIIVR